MPTIPTPPRAQRTTPEPFPYAFAHALMTGHDIEVVDPASGQRIVFWNNGTISDSSAGGR